MLVTTVSNTAREHGRYFGHPCSLAVSTARDHGPWTRVVYTELQGLSSAVGDISSREQHHYGSDADWGVLDGCTLAQPCEYDCLLLKWIQTGRTCISPPNLPGSNEITGLDIDRLDNEKLDSDGQILPATR